MDLYVYRPATTSRAVLALCDAESIEVNVRARVDELLAWFDPQVMPHHARGSEEATRRTIEWGHEKAKHWLSVLDRHYLARGGRWHVGDERTIADFFSASIVSLGELVAFDLGTYPNVRRWYDAVTTHPSWRRINVPFAGVVSAMRGAAHQATA